jgi:hypothetical protein
MLGGDIRHRIPTAVPVAPALPGSPSPAPIESAAAVASPVVVSSTRESRIGLSERKGTENRPTDQAFPPPETATLSAHRRAYERSRRFHRGVSRGSQGPTSDPPWPGLLALGSPSLAAVRLCGLGRSVNTAGLSKSELGRVPTPQASSSVLRLAAAVIREGDPR